MGPGGKVFCFDIQRAALTETRRQLAEQGLLGQVELILDGHQHMLHHLPADAPGRITAVMFNLGYLPGSDKRTVTRPDSTLPAIQQAADLLACGGMISILTYRGHAGGATESFAVEHMLETLNKGPYALERLDSRGPLLFLLKKE